MSPLSIETPAQFCDLSSSSPSSLVVTCNIQTSIIHTILIYNVFTPVYFLQVENQLCLVLHLD